MCRKREYLKKKVLCSDNRGLSLLELIVAVAIFAIVITPIFKSFSVSAQVNIKAKRLMLATDVAENVMESITAMTFNDVERTSGTITGYEKFITTDGQLVLLANKTTLFQTTKHNKIEDSFVVNSTDDFISKLKSESDYYNSNEMRIVYKKTTNILYIAYIGITPTSSQKDFKYAAVVSVNCTNAADTDAVVCPLTIDVYPYLDGSFFNEKWETVYGSIVNI